MSERHPISSAAADRRPAIWPWFAMPAAAFALFWTLHTVRHTGTAQSAAPTPAASAAPAQ